MIVMSLRSRSATAAPALMTPTCEEWCKPATIYLSFPMKIYTRTGDTGETALFGGGRVPKDDPRVAAYGDVDELNSAIGVARATAPTDAFDALLESIQRDLFSIGGHLATPNAEKVAKALAKAELSMERVTVFE